MKYIGIATLVFFWFAASAQSNVKPKSHINQDDGLAIEGYDPVSYFSGKPLEGKKELSIVHNGVKYLFHSSSNLQKFKNSPEAFLPAYGGWCAYAMGATGEKVKVDPETFKIVDGRLLLFYNFWGNNTLKDWNKEEAALKVKADANWKKITE